MADVNTLPRFLAAYRSDEVAITTADSSLTAPAAAGTVWTAGAQGSRIDRIIVKAQGTTTASMVRLFIHDGAAYFLFKEVSVSAIIPSAPVQAFIEDIDLAATPLYLSSGYTLRATTSSGEDFVVMAIGGDY